MRLNTQRKQMIYVLSWGAGTKEQWQQTFKRNKIFLKGTQRYENQNQVELDGTKRATETY